MLCPVSLEPVVRSPPPPGRDTTGDAVRSHAGAGRNGQLEREWPDRVATAGGRAGELCRSAVLFGDPLRVLSTVQRVLEITADEVRAVAADRLRPGNRAVLVYEPTTGADGADAADEEGEDA